MPIHVYRALERLAEWGRRAGDAVGWSRFVESIRRGYEKVRDIVEGNTQDSDGDGGTFGGTDPSAGGAQDSPNPVDQAQGYGHMGPPVGSGSYHHDDVPVLPDQSPSTPNPTDGGDDSPSEGSPQSQGSPNPADQAEGFGHMGPPEGSGTQSGGNPGQGSPNPADQAEGFGHMGPPGGHSAGGGNDGGSGNAERRQPGSGKSEPGRPGRRVRPHGSARRPQCRRRRGVVAVVVGAAGGSRFSSTSTGTGWS